MCIDLEIADLQERVSQGRMLLRFFTAYLWKQPGGQIKIPDRSMAEIEDHELFITHDEATNSTIIGIK